MSFRAIIVDDEPLAIEGLRRFCERNDKVRIVGEATDGNMGLRLVDEVLPDAVFLDIGMPGLTGLDVAARFGRSATSPLVVFVTAFDHFATQAFDLSVVDYVLKPLDRVRLDRAIERVDLLVSKRDTDAPAAQEFWVPSRGSMVRLAASSIRRVDAERDYVRLTTDERSYLLREPISAIEARLDPALFVRIHRSAMLRNDTIKELRHTGGGVWAAIDEAGQPTRIGRSYLARLREQLRC